MADPSVWVAFIRQHSAQPAGYRWVQGRVLADKGGRREMKSPIKTGLFLDLQTPPYVSPRCLRWKVFDIVHMAANSPFRVVGNAGAGLGRCVLVRIGE
ncbi:hypothetical protein [Pseudomonas mediterranea]|uniref:hypothetical protein n=1 Tax=Pseudomonas mediterranea TaxID=183795 RepID=UPI00052FB5E0|nr:hypothetical protein [Pseudomonas mediterranea]KGU84852.1 hypothetical protein N005_15965 [Pseudomonas mediterranea CFBP 5447]